MKKLFNKFDLYLAKEFDRWELITFSIVSMILASAGVDAIQISKIITGLIIIVPSVLLAFGCLKAIAYKYYFQEKESDIC